MDDLSEILLPTHRAKKFINKWAKKSEINPKAIKVMHDRIAIIVERANIKAESVWKMNDVLNTIVKRYDGIIYEENEEIMSIAFKEELPEKPYYLGLGNSSTFNLYLYTNYPELLI